MFRLLGWAFAKDGETCNPFSNECEALGVSFKLCKSSERIALICNTESRVAELCADLLEVVNSGAPSSKNAQRLRGRMQFADAQLYGRTGKHCLKTLSDFSEGRRHKLLEKDVFFLRTFVNFLSKIAREKSERQVVAMLSSLQMRAMSVIACNGSAVSLVCSFWESRGVSFLWNLTSMREWFWASSRRSK